MGRDVELVKSVVKATCASATWHGRTAVPARTAEREMPEGMDDVDTAMVQLWKLSRVPYRPVSCDKLKPILTAQGIAIDEGEKVATAWSHKTPCLSGAANTESR